MKLNRAESIICFTESKRRTLRIFCKSCGHISDWNTKRMKTHKHNGEPMKPLCLGDIIPEGPYAKYVNLPNHLRHGPINSPLKQKVKRHGRYIEQSVPKNKYVDWLEPLVDIEKQKC